MDSQSDSGSRSESSDQVTPPHHNNTNQTDKPTTFEEALRWHRTHGVLMFRGRDIYNLYTNDCNPISNLDSETVASSPNDSMRPSTSDGPSETEDIWYPAESLNSPFSNLSLANSKELWESMVDKEKATAHHRNSRLFEDFSSPLSKMRSILIDHLMQICEFYHLRRATFYLALDCLDRYLSINPAVPKKYFQLLGLSSLCIAVKVEERNCPKLSQFTAMACDAYTEQDIIDCEFMLLCSLGCDINSITPIVWLSLYMQTNIICNISEKEPKAVFNYMPEYLPFHFVKASLLIDLFALEPGFLLFRYSIIAAAAMYLMFGKAVALKVSGLQWEDLEDCAEYMAVCHKALCESPNLTLHNLMSIKTAKRQTSAYELLKVFVPNLSRSEGYTYQIHLVTLQDLEKVTKLRLQGMGPIVEETSELPRAHDLDEDSVEDLDEDSVEDSDKDSDKNSDEDSDEDWDKDSDENSDDDSDKDLDENSDEDSDDYFSMSEEGEETGEEEPTI